MCYSLTCTEHTNACDVLLAGVGVAAVKAWKEEAGHYRLVGYVAPLCDTAAAQAWCRQQLLPFMVPSQVLGACSS